MASITVRRPSGLAVLFRFGSRNCIRLGRGFDNDLVLREPSVSRHHAEIRREGEGWVVVDLGSANGTQLWGESIDGPRPLGQGDEVGIGDTLLVFDSREEAPAPADADPTTVREISERAAAEAAEPRLVGRSRPIVRLLDQLEKVAPSAANVLIIGENGTGKELVARLIHQRSARAVGPFVVVNCPALPGSLLEAELFGIEAGVATDVEARTGRFEQAEGGTLLLDEIGDMDHSAQAKILRVLDDRILERVGGSEPIPLDVRILAATNHDLQADMEEGRFRRDLFHRLSTVTIQVPPLRERREDIPLLAEHFLAGGGGPEVELSPEAQAFLMEYEFPGNVRELKHLLEGARLFAQGPVLDLADLQEATHLGGHAAGGPGPPLDVPEALLRKLVQEGGSFWELVREPFLQRQLSREDARALVRLVYERAGGGYKEAARLLRIESQHKKFYNFLREHQLRVGD